MNRRIYFAGFILSIASGICAMAGEQGSIYGATTVTNATGTITRLNYNEDGTPQGFLVGTNILLTFQSAVCGGIGTLGTAGNSVTYSGTAFSTASGFQLVSVSSFSNTTTSATYTAPTGAPVAYGPTSGTISQLNYDGGGTLNGFLFTPAGSTSELFVATGGRPSSTLTTLATAGATVSVTGTTSSRSAACAATGNLQTVNATSLTIGSTTITIGVGGHPGHR